MAKAEEFVVGIDFGTSKIAVIVAKILPNNELEIVGIGKSDSKGMRRGSIANLREVEEALKSAVNEAENMSGYSIEKAFVNVGGCHIHSINSKGVVSVSSKDLLITPNDVNRVLVNACSIKISQDQQIFNKEAQEFIVDDHDGISDPVGMRGQRLEANVHLIIAPKITLQNIATVVHNSGIEVADFVFNLIADAYAVLTPEEKDLGVALINIGHSTTGIAVFEKGAICHNHIIPIGGEHFTNDLAVLLKIGNQDAEIIKKKHGCCLTTMVSDSEEEVVEIENSATKKKSYVSKINIANILQTRCVELLQFAYSNLEQAKLLDVINSGIVLTGGGSILPGVQEVAERIFNHHTRIGEPIGISGLTTIVSSPIFSTGIGLVKYGAKRIALKKSYEKKSIFSRILNKIYEIFE